MSTVIRPSGLGGVFQPFVMAGGGSVGSQEGIRYWTEDNQDLRIMAANGYDDRGTINPPNAYLRDITAASNILEIPNKTGALSDDPENPLLAYNYPGGNQLGFQYGGQGAGLYGEAAVAGFSGPLPFLVKSLVAWTNDGYSGQTWSFGLPSGAEVYGWAIAGATYRNATMYAPNWMKVLKGNIEWDWAYGAAGVSGAQQHQLSRHMGTPIFTLAAGEDVRIYARVSDLYMVVAACVFYLV